MPIRRKPTCWCNAYPFPHKVGGGKCHRRIPLRKTRRRVDIKRKALKRARDKGRYLPRSR